MSKVCPELDRERLEWYQKNDGGLELCLMPWNWTVAEIGFTPETDRLELMVFGLNDDEDEQFNRFRDLLEAKEAAVARAREYALRLVDLSGGNPVVEALVERVKFLEEQVTQREKIHEELKAELESLRSEQEFFEGDGSYPQNKKPAFYRDPSFAEDPKINDVSFILDGDEIPLGWVPAFDLPVLDSLPSQYAIRYVGNPVPQTAHEAMGVNTLEAERARHAEKKDLLPPDLAEDVYKGMVDERDAEIHKLRHCLSEALERCDMYQMEVNGLKGDVRRAEEEYEKARAAAKYATAKKTEAESNLENIVEAVSRLAMDVSFDRLKSREDVVRALHALTRQPLPSVEAIDF